MTTSRYTIKALDLTTWVTYERAGFRRDRKIGKHRWVVVTTV